MTRINAHNAARLLGVSRQQLYKWRRKGMLPATVSGRGEAFEWNEDELRRWRENRRHGEPGQVEDGAPRPAADRPQKVDARVAENRAAIGGLVDTLLAVTASIREIDGKAASLIARLDANLKATKDSLTAAARRRGEQNLSPALATSTLAQRLGRLESSNQELRRACAATLALLTLVGEMLGRFRPEESDQLRKPLSEAHRLSAAFAES